jgi:hypothetical protein
MVHCPPVVPGQRLDLLLELLSVAQVVVHRAPGIAGDTRPGDPHPGVGVKAGVPVVLDVALRRHVLHFLHRGGGGAGPYRKKRQKEREKKQGKGRNKGTEKKV